LAIFSYYVSYLAVEKYQKDVKEKLAWQKAKLAGTKEKVKKKIEERKIHKAEVKSQKVEYRRQINECGSGNAEVGKRAKTKG
jgi:hypothetical protein